MELTEPALGGGIAQLSLPSAAWKEEISPSETVRVDSSGLRSQHLVRRTVMSALNCGSPSLPARLLSNMARHRMAVAPDVLPEGVHNSPGIAAPVRESGPEVEQTAPENHRQRTR